jgi:D-erythronate 2-dehydrogenase
VKVVVTGAAGFLGRQLTRTLLERGTLTGPSGAQEEIDRLVLFDALPIDRHHGDERVERIAGDISDPATVLALCDRDDLSVFHLASVLSGTGEADFDLAFRVNLEGGRNVLEALRARTGMPRLVLASTTAVFGEPAVHGTVGDTTRHTPQTTYGVTKAILELLVNDYTRKGFLDGRTPRLPTIIVRPGSPNAATSGFASSVIREPLNGVDVVVPVPAQTRMIVTGHRTAVACLVALHEVDGAQLGGDRAVTLPSISVTIQDLIDSLHRVAGDRPLGRISIEPDPEVVKVVNTWAARSSFEQASLLGLPVDPDADSIVRAFIEDFLG